ncbi:MAG: hypothetical protein LBB89_05575 [Treponema sp.]|jgi:hypothetical protein|nr:hypothetical protein [Treponema sp.]
MKNTLKLLVLAAGVLLALAALLLTGCPTDSGDGDDGTPPEKLTTKQRWGSGYDKTTSVTVAHSVGDDDVCTITVGGTALTTMPAWDYIWKAQVFYKYTAVKDKIYTYSFEAWTDGADRTLNVQWYEDNNTKTYHGTGYESVGNPVFKITSERKTYTITGSKPIPKSGVQNLSFQCANQTGTFYVKILGITQHNYVPPEDRPVKDRWWKWVDDTSTATLDYSVADDGVCTNTVGGTPESQENIWKASARYSYTAKAGTNYAYTFEAWTESGTRELNIQYYEDNDERVYLWSKSRITITATRTTYTIYGTNIPKNGIQPLVFQGADQTGTFYVKVLEIKEYEIGKLTITNFSGSPGLTKNSWVFGWAYRDDDDGKDEGGLSFGNDLQVTGSSITLPVWEYDEDEYGYGELLYFPFTGNVTVPAGNLWLIQGDEHDSITYKNKVPITFRNGNATINFGTQMEVEEDDH